MHLAACAVALWPCVAHGPPLTAHPCPDPLDHHRTISRKERAYAQSYAKKERKLVLCTFPLFSDFSRNKGKKSVSVQRRFTYAIRKCKCAASVLPTRFEEQTVLNSLNQGAERLRKTKSVCLGDRSSHVALLILLAAVHRQYCWCCCGREARAKTKSVLGRSLLATSPC